PGSGPGRVRRVHRGSSLGTAVGHGGGFGPGATVDHRDTQGHPDQAGASGVDRCVRLVAPLPGRGRGADPARTRPAVVVDVGAPGAAVDLSRGAPHVRTRQRPRRQHRDTARAAPHRGLPDGRGPGAAADRRAVGLGARAVDHHADLSDAAQAGRGAANAGPPRRGQPPRYGAGPAGAGGWLPPRHAAGAIRNRGDLVSTLMQRGPAAAAEKEPTRASAPLKVAVLGARATPTDWPDTRVSRLQVWERLTRAPFVLAKRNSQYVRANGLEALLDWLGEQPGDTWQQRWLATGAEAARGQWGDGLQTWLCERRPETTWRAPAMSSALVMAISIDLVRPSLAWLTSHAFGRGQLVAALTA